jgi:hypothetical protein
MKQNASKMTASLVSKTIPCFGTNAPCRHPVAPSPTPSSSTPGTPLALPTTVPAERLAPRLRRKRARDVFESGANDSGTDGLQGSEAPEDPTDELGATLGTLMVQYQALPRLTPKFVVAGVSSGQVQDFEHLLAERDALILRML